MNTGLHQLFWKDQLVGTITDVGWTDFPWAGGKFTLGQPSKELRDVLEYISKESATDEGLHDWPFPDEMGEHWRVVKPDGRSAGCGGSQPSPRGA